MRNMPRAVVWRLATWLLVLASPTHGCGQPAAVSPSAVAAPSRLVATVYGAAGQVSGSLAVLDTAMAAGWVDCGSYAPEGEGVKLERQQRASEQSATVPVDPRSIAALFLTHAHTDHVGRLPLLVEAGFRGPIYLTGATAALLPPMLRMQIRFDESRVRAWRWSKQARQRAAGGQRALNLHWHPNCRYGAAIAAGNLETARTTLDELTSRIHGQDPGLRLTVCQRCTEEEVAAILSLCRRLRYGERLEAAPVFAVQCATPPHPGLGQRVVRGCTVRVHAAGALLRRRGQRPVAVVRRTAAGPRGGRRVYRDHLRRHVPRSVGA